MGGSKFLKLALSILASSAAFQYLPASAESNEQRVAKIAYSQHNPYGYGIWHKSPLASQVIDQLLIRNWTSMNNKNGVDWGSQISDLALNLASKEISNYATNTIQKFPFVLGASMNIDIRTEGTTNIGGDLLFKIADFGLKDDQTRDGLAFLHTKYTGSLSNDSTWNAGLGIRHLIGEDVLAGINGYWDYRTTNYSNAHSRFGVGSELFWNTLSLTNNWYIAGTGTKDINIGGTEYYERVVPGWDIELGYRLPSDPRFAFFARGFRWDYRERNDNTGVQAKVSYQVTPRVRVDSWVSNEIPANTTQLNGDLSNDDVVFGLNFTLTANPVIYKPNDLKQMLQQEMVNPVRRRYDVLLERWAKETESNSSFTNSVGGA